MDERRAAITESVLRQVDAFGPGVADVHIVEEGDGHPWGIDVLPSAPGAPSFHVAGFADWDEVAVTIGDTHTSFWGTPTELAGWVVELLVATAAGFPVRRWLRRTTLAPWTGPAPH